MNCSNFKILLEESIQNRTVPSSAEFNQHRKECAHCAELANGSQFLDLIIEQWKKEEHPVDLVDRVLYHLAPSRKDNSVTVAPVVPTIRRQEVPEAVHRRNKSNFAAISAAVLVMITCVFLVRSQQTDESRPVIANNLDKRDVEIDEIIFEVGSAYLTLANNTADSVTGAVNIVSSRKKTENEVINSEQDTEYRWIKSIGNDLKPIQKDLGEAMDFLYESLPEDTSSPSTI